MPKKKRNKTHFTDLDLAALSTRSGLRFNAWPHPPHLIAPLYYVADVSMVVAAARPASAPDSASVPIAAKTHIASDMSAPRPFFSGNHSLTKVLSFAEIENTMVKSNCGLGGDNAAVTSNFEFNSNIPSVIYDRTVDSSYAVSVPRGDIRQFGVGNECINNSINVGLGSVDLDDVLGRSHVSSTIDCTLSALQNGSDPLSLPETDTNVRADSNMPEFGTTATGGARVCAATLMPDDLGQIGNIRVEASRTDAASSLGAVMMLDVIDRVMRPIVLCIRTDWSSLFKNLPRNAGVYTSRNFDMVESDGTQIPLAEVIQAGMDCWKDYLVGFFLDSPSLLRS